jgi:hypothetical protein
MFVIVMTATDGTLSVCGPYADRRKAAAATRFIDPYEVETTVLPLESEAFTLLELERQRHA